MIALIQIDDTRQYGSIRSKYLRIETLLLEQPEALFGLSYTFGEYTEPVGTRVKIDADANVASCRLLRRKLRRAERLADRLRFLRHNCGLEVRASLPGNARSMRYARRFATLSNRLARVNGIIAILTGLAGGSR